MAFNEQPLLRSADSVSHEQMKNVAHERYEAFAAAYSGDAIQWGSCSPNGRITLNPHLVKTPRECIDYVILHELCHIAEHNHSERFYRLLKQVMPHWEKVKACLDGMAALVLSDLPDMDKQQSLCCGQKFLGNTDKKRLE